MAHKILSLYEHAYGLEEDHSDLDIDTSLLDELIEIVGSEAEVEAAAKESFDRLASAFEKNEVEINPDEVPEKLAVSALIVNLVENGKLGPDEADTLIQKYLD